MDVEFLAMLLKRGAIGVPSGVDPGVETGVVDQQRRVDRRDIVGRRLTALEGH